MKFERSTYPAQLSKARWRTWPFVIAWMSFFAVLLTATFTQLHSAWQWILFCIPFAFAAFTSASLIAGQSKVSVLPYYSKKIKGANTYVSGWALARNYQKLEQLASHSGLRQLSSFGLSLLPVERKEISWHSAADGIDAIQDLIVALESREPLVDDPAAVSDELGKFLEALTLAKEEDILFALILRVGGTSYTPMAWDEDLGSP